VGLLVGYLKFCGLCGLGLFANLAVASVLHQWAPAYPSLAGTVGALFGAVWNYLSTALAVW
jgi:dolichol-phosphate mannosyltransferase